MAVKETPDLIFRQSLRGLLESLANAVGDRVTGGVAEEEGGAGGTVIPYGQSGLEMRHTDGGGGVEGSVDGAEAEDLGFGAAGGGAAQPGAKVAQGRIAILPELARGMVATEEDLGCGGGPVESTPQFAGDGRQVAGVEVATFGKTVAALHPGPEAAVGKAVVGFGAVEALGQLTLGDVSDEADTCCLGSCGPFADLDSSGALSVPEHPLHFGPFPHPILSAVENDFFTSSRRSNRPRVS
jgi:hypothetical protein